MIASGHRDGTVRVWKVRPADISGQGSGSGSGGVNANWSASVMGEWGLGDATIGRVEVSFDRDARLFWPSEAARDNPRLMGSISGGRFSGTRLDRF